MGRPAAWEYLMTAKERRDLRALRILLAGGSPTKAGARVGLSERQIYRLGLVDKAREIRRKRSEQASCIC